MNGLNWNLGIQCAIVKLQETQFENIVWLGYHESIDGLSYLSYEYQNSAIVSELLFRYHPECNALIFHQHEFLLTLLRNVFQEIGMFRLTKCVC